jgi:hypothetical protein
VGVVIEMVRRFLRYVRYVHPVQWAAGFAVGCVVTAVPLTVVAVMHPTIAVCYATDGTDVDTTFLNGGADYYPVDVAFTVTHPTTDTLYIEHRTTFILKTSQPAHVYLAVVTNG